MNEPNWLPSLVLWTDHGNNWETYLNVIYDFFCQDFVYDKPVFEGRMLRLKRHPLYDEKEATFWHLITTGKEEEERLPDFKRCERIRWPRPVIDNSREEVVKVWKNKRRANETRICLWLESQEYLVVLAERSNYILPWTAYPVTSDHRKRKLQKEYEEYYQQSQNN